MISMDEFLTTMSENSIFRPVGVEISSPVNLVGMPGGAPDTLPGV